MVIVSHDRYLLDAVVTHIVEIEDGRLTTFTGDYSMYVIDKEEPPGAPGADFIRSSSGSSGAWKMAIKRYALWVLITINLPAGYMAWKPAWPRRNRWIDPCWNAGAWICS